MHCKIWILVPQVPSGYEEYVHAAINEGQVIDRPKGKKMEKRIYKFLSSSSTFPSLHCYATSTIIIAYSNITIAIFIFLHPNLTLTKPPTPLPFRLNLFS